MKPNDYFSKVNQKLVDLANEIIEKSENFNDDYDFRDNYLVFNIKVHGWVDQDSIIEEFTNSLPINISEQIFEELKNEFDDNRFNNIHSHECESEIYWFVDWIDGCAFDTIEYVKKEVIPQAIKTKETVWPYLNENLKKLRSPKSIEKAVMAFFADSFEGRKHISHFNKKDVGTLGKSGGWISVCERPSFDIDTAENIAWMYESADNNADFNYMLDKDYYSKKAVLALLKEEYQNIIDFENALAFVKNHIEEVKRGLNEQVKNRALEEMAEWFTEKTGNEYVTGPHSKLYLFDEDQIDWINNPLLSLINCTSNSLTPVKFDKKGFLFTARGISIDYSQAKTMFELISRMLNKIGLNEKKIINHLNIGSYTLESIQNVGNDFLIKAGCHKMLWSNFQMIFNQNK